MTEVPSLSASAAEETAAISGRVFARTTGMTVAADCTRYRMRKARVGQRILAVFTDAGTPAGMILEEPTGWHVAFADGGALAHPVATFPQAVAAVETRAGITP